MCLPTPTPFALRKIYVCGAVRLKGVFARGKDECMAHGVHAMQLELKALLMNLEHLGCCGLLLRRQVRKHRRAVV